MISCDTHIINPFGEMAFLDLWWSHCSEGFTLLDEMADHPYWQRVFGLRRVGGAVRVVEACGAGVGDYLEFDWRQVTPEDVERFVDAFVAGRWADLLLLPRLDEEGPTAKLIEAIAEKKRLPVYKLAYDLSPYTALEGTWEEFICRRRSGKSRSAMRRKARRLGEKGTLEFRHFSTPAEVEALMDRVFQIYERRAEGVYRGPLWLSDSGQTFLKAWAVSMAERGVMDLAVMFVGERPLAFCYGFYNDTDYYQYGLAFDPDPQYYKYSPGLLLEEHQLKFSYSLGLERYDFLLGNESYKQEWATANRTINTYVIGKRAAKPVARLYFQGLKARQAVRRSATLRPAAERVASVLRRS